MISTYFSGFPRQIPKKDELEIGKRVIVYYDPKNPGENALTDFGELSMNIIVPLLFLLLAIGVFVWNIGSRRRQNRMKLN
ncbi:MAG: DUF3592 domain-containing protein, partial [Candidatus Acidiferrum sp.]